MRWVPHVAQVRGIAVRINFADHPPPHLHAFYGSRQVLVDISARKRLRGALPPAQMQKLFEWMSHHEKELMVAWNAASRQIHPSWITPP